jgi:hypothetical protein
MHRLLEVALELTDNAEAARTRARFQEYLLHGLLRRARGVARRIENRVRRALESAEAAESGPRAEPEATAG